MRICGRPTRFHGLSISVEKDIPPGSRPWQSSRRAYRTRVSQNNGEEGAPSDATTAVRGRPCVSNTAIGQEDARRLPSTMLRLTPRRTRFLASRCGDGEDQVTALWLNATRSCSARGLIPRDLLGRSADRREEK